MNLRNELHNIVRKAFHTELKGGKVYEDILKEVKKPNNKKKSIEEFKKNIVKEYIEKKKDVKKDVKKKDNKFTANEIKILNKIAKGEYKDFFVKMYYNKMKSKYGEDSISKFFKLLKTS